MSVWLWSHGHKKQQFRLELRVLGKPAVDLCASSPNRQRQAGSDRQAETEVGTQSQAQSQAQPQPQVGTEAGTATGRSRHRHETGRCQMVSKTIEVCIGATDEKR